MTSAGIRCLAATVLVAALAATTGCKGDSGSGEGTAPRTSQQETGNGTGTPEAAETLASVFPGSDDEGGSEPTIHMSQARVNKPTTGNVAINARGGEQPKPLQNLAYRAESNGQGGMQGTNCLGPHPPNPCAATIEHTPAQPGPYSGELVITTADGTTTTYPVVGFAVGDAASTTQSPTSETSTPESPTTTAPPTPFEPTTTPPPPTENGTSTP
ncbi:hypothetical protein ACFYW8_36810 [Streptomyces sp. NPDC002742]|uniref:hypothetical protein n=1 Tax=Streptomyces sp. NPDC002742 TaxID=3364663 RepID=UPI003683959B